MRTAEQERARYTYLKTSEVAKVLSVSTSHVIHLIQSGALEAVDIRAGDRPEYRVSPDALDAFLQERKVA